MGFLEPDAMENWRTLWPTRWNLRFNGILRAMKMKNWRKFDLQDGILDLLGFLMPGEMKNLWAHWLTKYNLRLIRILRARSNEGLKNSLTYNLETWTHWDSLSQEIWRIEELFDLPDWIFDSLGFLEPGTMKNWRTLWHKRWNLRFPWILNTRGK